MLSLILLKSLGWEVSCTNEGAQSKGFWKACCELSGFRICSTLETQLGYYYYYMHMEEIKYIETK